jgi:hypothetical protein
MWLFHVALDLRHTRSTQADQPQSLNITISINFMMDPDGSCMASLDLHRDYNRDPVVIFSLKFPQRGEPCANGKSTGYSLPEVIAVTAILVADKIQKLQGEVKLIFWKHRSIFIQFTCSVFGVNAQLTTLS